jgi:hypothetical protein
MNDSDILTVLARIETRLDRIEQALQRRGRLSAEDRRVDSLLPY